MPRSPPTKRVGIGQPTHGSFASLRPCLAKTPPVLPCDQPIVPQDLAFRSCPLRPRSPLRFRRVPPHRYCPWLQRVPEQTSQPALRLRTCSAPPLPLVQPAAFGCLLRTRCEIGRA